MDLCNQDQLRQIRKQEYRLVICEAWRRNGMTNAAVAAATGRGGSLISKVKNGRISLCADLQHRLIDLFELDRVRLFIAVELAEDGMLYFDPTFKQLCHASTCFVKQMLSLIGDDISPEHKAMFAAFSEQTIAIVVGQAGLDVTGRFSTMLPAITPQTELPNPGVGPSARPAAA